MNGPLRAPRHLGQFAGWRAGFIFAAMSLRLLPRLGLASWLPWLCLGLLLLNAGCRHTPGTRDASGRIAPQAESREPDPKQVEAQAHYMTGIIHEQNQSPDEAAKAFTLAATAQPGDSALILDVSERLLASQKVTEALDVLALAARQPSVSGHVLARLASVQAGAGRTNEAVATARRALTTTPESPEATRTLFLLLMRAKQFPDARALADRAFAQTNLTPEVLAGLSEMYLVLGQVHPTERDACRTNALTALTRAAALNPTDPDLRNKIADGFFLLGQPDRAAQIYLDLLKQYPDNEVVRTSVRAKLIETFLRGKDRSQAVEQLEQVLRDNPGNAQAYFVLGGIFLEQRAWEQAADRFAKAVLFNPDLEPAYYDLALAQINTDDAGDALRTLAKARARFGDTFSLEFISGLAETTRTNYTAALKHLTAAEVIAGASDQQRLSEAFFYQLGAVHERLGNFPQAAQALERAITLAPDFAEAMNYLGYMWAERGEHLERAHELLIKAVEIQPKNPAYLDSLAWVLFKLGRPAEALPHMEQSIALNEKPDPTLYDHLGDIQAALGQAAAARVAWQRALALDPTNEKLRQKLDAPPAN